MTIYFDTDQSNVAKIETRIRNGFETMLREIEHHLDLLVRF